MWIPSGPNSSTGFGSWFLIVGCPGDNCACSDNPNLGGLGSPICNANLAGSTAEYPCVDADSTTTTTTTTTVADPCPGAGACTYRCSIVGFDTSGGGLDPIYGYVLCKNQCPPPGNCPPAGDVGCTAATVGSLTSRSCIG
jgi:hypothetical protein